MNKYFIRVLLVFLSLSIFTSCEEEVDDVIVIGNGSQDQNEEEESSEDEEEQSDEEPEDREWDLFQPYECYTSLSNQTLDIVTWNIERFPKSNQQTINGLAELINNSRADIIALQELQEPDFLEDVIGLTSGWAYKVYDVRGDLELGYLYKTSEIISISNLSIIYPDNSSAFYRPPVLTTVEHANGQIVTLMNIHLKCCGGTENVNRRKEASVLLKKYVDDNMSDEKVIILGDWNDELSETENNPFQNFLDDTNNYYFSDLEIDEGPSTNYSYPSWPSHLDHILVTNELFDNLEFVTTLTFNQCISGYSSNISDHRPVMLSIN